MPFQVRDKNIRGPLYVAPAAAVQGPQRGPCSGSALSSATIGADTVQTVNARELHAFLGIGRDFSTWIKHQINEYKFSPGMDFVTVEGLSAPSSGSAKARPQRTVEYALTIDMAKELAMVERNEKGREARRYFIECEKQLRAKPQEAQAVPAAVRVLVAGHGGL